MSDPTTSTTAEAESGCYEEALAAPFRFDVSIGYWTGDPDLDLLARALATVPIDTLVAREVRGGQVRLVGDEVTVREQARLLRAEGLT